jgi:hypothetical protein
MDVAVRSFRTEPLKIQPIIFLPKVFGSPETFFQKRFLVGAGQSPVLANHLGQGPHGEVGVRSYRTEP